MLVAGSYYHKNDVFSFESVRAKDVWMPNVPVKDAECNASLGCTLEHFWGVEGAVMGAGTEFDHVDYMAEVLATLNGERGSGA
jgi:hypothetical protein